MFPQTQLENQALTWSVKVSPSFINTTALQLNISLTEKQADEGGEWLELLHMGMWGAVVL